MNLWACPSAREFMHDVCSLVRTSEQFVCLVLPDPHRAGFIEAFVRYADNYLGQVSVCTLANTSTLDADFLASFFPEILDASLAISLASSGTSTYLLLTFPCDLDDSDGACRAFLENLVQLAKERKKTGGILLWRLIVVWPAHLPWPHGGEGLVVRFWWGQLHPSDTEYAIEHCCREVYRDELKEWEYLWLYSLCQGLAVMDPLLSLRIFQELPLDLEEIQSLLADHPLMRVAPSIRQAIVRVDTQGASRLSRTEPPEGDIRTLWSIGALDIRENGLTALHPAAVCVANRISSLEKLVVAGQIKVFFPIVQEVHSFLCSQLRKVCGDCWHKKDKTFQNLNDEIGGLPRYMSEYLKGQHDPDLYSLAVQWRNIRNSLAHGQSISCRMAVDACRLYGELRNRLQV
ncbi:MAG: hypothetical protein IJU76_03880 [Desulfovibrionaceae bacterium]|nr:hypothetical protein [Desulfovibrionaceae bacterium]